MGWSILVFMLVVVAIEALIGASRGVKFSGIRLIFTALSTLIAVLVAKSLTITIVLKIAAADGIEATSITDLVQKIMSNSTVLSQYSGILSMLTPHIAGILISVFIPVVFVVLFLLFKFISLFLYLIAKGIIKSIENKKANEEKVEGEAPVSTGLPAYSRICGGLIGAFVGLVACAIILVPVLSLSSAASKSLATIQKLVNMGTPSETASLDNSEEVLAVLNKLYYGSTIPAYAADGTEDELFVTLKKLIDSYANSPANAIFKYTGAEAISNIIISAASTVTPSDIGSEVTTTEAYNITVAIEEIVELIEPVSELVISIAENDGITTESLSKITEFVEKFNETSLFSNEDKLALVSACKEVVTETIYAGLGVEVNDTTAPSKQYASLDEFKSDMDALVSMGDTLASISGGSNAGKIDFENVDVDALLKDEAKLKEFLRSVLTLSNGTEILANLINKNVENYTEGKVKDVTSAAVLNSVGTETILEVSNELMKFAKYNSSTILTDEISTEIKEALDLLAEKGLLTKESAEKIKAEFKLN